MRRLVRTSRGGFTLIELLVVIAIIAVLIALLLPAVQKVREAANRANCASNMKNIALAVHNHQDSLGHLPRSGVDEGLPGFGGSCCDVNLAYWSWLARLLPYVEQENLYRLGNLPRATHTQARSTMMNQVIRVYFCPSDNAISLGTQTNRNNHSGWAIGLTNYKGVAGANWQWGTWRCGGTGGKNSNGLDNGDGMFYRSDTREKTRLTDVIDGTSNTFMIGEDIPTLNNHCGWPSNNYATGTCCIPPNVSVVGTVFKINDWGNVYSFRSRHPGGLQFAMADGSVRFVPQTINITTYRQLATKAGGEVVQLP